MDVNWVYSRNVWYDKWKKADSVHTWVRPPVLTQHQMLWKQLKTRRWPLVSPLVHFLQNTWVAHSCWSLEKTHTLAFCEVFLSVEHFSYMWVKTRRTFSDTNDIPAFIPTRTRAMMIISKDLAALLVTAKSAPVIRKTLFNNRQFFLWVWMRGQVNVVNVVCKQDM